MSTEFKPGDEVEYRTKFLRAISWHTNVTKGMIVTMVSPSFDGWQLVTVRGTDGRVWCVNALNLVLKSRLHLEEP